MEAMEKMLSISPWLGVAGMIFAVLVYLNILKFPDGNEKMKDIGEKIHLGAMVFLKREYTIILAFMAVVFIALSSMIGIWTGVTYLLGALCSMGAGWLGMEAATRANTRSCQGAKDGGISRALMIAYQGGSVMGITIAALGVAGLGFIFYFARKLGLPETPEIINGFAMGASSIALFARVGGGIYTKSADVGADLVGKIEAGIPEDDPRNPGVIADNVGDNVGDTAGMGADLFESYVGSVIAAITIGITMNLNQSQGEMLRYAAYPIFLITVGLLASLVGISSMNFLKKMEPSKALNYSTYISGGLFVLAAYYVTKGVMGPLNVFYAAVAGIVCGLLIAAESEYFTSGPPIQEIAKASQSGAATTIITGLAVGFKSIILPVLTLCMAIIVSYKFSGLYGIAIAGIGMLSTIGAVMTTDSYGPIADNAGGIAEMSGAGPEIRKITDKLDSIGNTTAAVGKGFAIGSAALTALALFSAYQKTVGLETIDLSKASTVIGLFLGAMIPFAIAAMTMEAVGRAANVLVIEIRRQFKEIKGLMEGEADPEIDKCIEIVTSGALKEMVAPGIMAIAAPLVVGFVIGKEALGGFLAGATVVGLLLGIFMSNGGGAWDNAKKWIEEGNLGGKGSDAHKAAVVGDTVGDPFKDTSGPSMNILIKLMSVVSLVFAPVLKEVTPWLENWMK